MQNEYWSGAWAARRKRRLGELYSQCITSSTLGSTLRWRENHLQLHSQSIRKKEAKSICNICPVKYGNAPTPNQSGNRAERGCFCRNNILDLGGWINHTWKALTFSIIVTRANQYPLLKLVLRLFDYVQIAPKTRRFNVSYETRTNSS